MFSLDFQIRFLLFRLNENITDTSPMSIYISLDINTYEERPGTYWHWPVM